MSYRTFKQKVHGGALALAVCLGLVGAGAVAAEPAETLFPAADTYVHQGAPHEAHGGEDHLEVGSQLAANRRAFLRFELSEDPRSITAATLNLYFYWGSAFAALRDDGVLIEVRAVDDEPWDEDTLTWADAPPLGQPVAHAPIGGAGSWIEFDITDYVEARSAEGAAFSIAVCFSHEDYDSSNRRIRFRSTDHVYADERPFLEVHYEDEPPPRYTLAVSADPGEGGTVEVDGMEASLPYEKTYPESTSVELRAAPRAGWEFVHWEINEEGIAPPERLITLVMDGNTHAVARFRPSEYVITATAGPGGAIAPAGEVHVPHGARQDFTIIPEAGREISEVTVDGRSAFDELVWQNGKATYTFADVASDHTIHAWFADPPYVTLTVEIVGPGRVELNGEPYRGPVPVPRASEARLEALPAQGGAFAGWGDGRTEPTRTIVPAEDTTVRAYFRTEPDCVALGPHPVPAEGAVWWYSFPSDAVAATLTLFAVDGTPLYSAEVDPGTGRYPAAGRWEPRDAQGRLLGSGLYLLLVQVRHEGGQVSRCPVVQVVIDR